MSFFEVLCGNLVSVGLDTIFFTCASILLFCNMPRKGRRHYAVIMGLLVLYVFLISLIATIFFEFGFFAWEHNGGEIIIEYIQIAGIFLLLRAAYGKSHGTCLAAAIFLELLREFGWNLADIFTPNKFYYLEIWEERMEYLFQEWVLTPCCFLLVLLYLYKTKVGEVFWQWEEYKRKRFFLFFMSFCPVLSQIFQEWMERSEKDVGYNPAAAFVFFLVLYIIFLFVGQKEMQRKRIEEQEVSLRQQEAYIRNLEELQKEVRRFRHDFKNMMSGMYLQAKEGDAGAIQEYIQEMTEDFDVQVGSQIRIMNQLANIRVTEVKGLFLEKMKVMQEEDVHCELEVLYPFEKTRMRTTDLCRALGILLDNAVEEVRGKDDGKLHVMISCRDGYTTFRVKNSLYSAVDFHRLGTSGYSTKGEDRGIGLENYKRILARYDKVLPLTTIQDGYFIQELKIQEG